MLPPPSLLLRLLRWRVFFSSSSPYYLKSQKNEWSMAWIITTLKYGVDCRVCFWHCSLFFRFLNLFIQSNANSRELVLRTLANTQIHSDKYAVSCVASSGSVSPGQMYSSSPSTNCIFIVKPQKVKCCARNPFNISKSHSFILNSLSALVIHVHLVFFARYIRVRAHCRWGFTIPSLFFLVLLLVISFDLHLCGACLLSRPLFNWSRENSSGIERQENKNQTTMQFERKILLECRV